MALIRWQPLREIESLQQEMNRLFESLNLEGDRGITNFGFTPAAELQETPEAIHLKLELPGMEAQDLDIQVTREAVSVSGERKAETQTEVRGITRSEFRYGRFQRVIPLPTKVNNDEVKAEYKDGILRLTLPKVDADKQRAVKVQLASS